MTDLSLPIYDSPRKWISDSRKRNVSWDELMLAKKDSEEKLMQFLSDKEDDDYWPKLTVDEWKKLVGLQKEAEESAKKVDFLAGIAQIYEKGQENDTQVPLDPSSSWQLYKKKLEKDGFKEETISEIERTTAKILKRLNGDTAQSGPVKGLVIGNVQSGKTANMAALMSMSADWGWNMFIILSGTIENLRKQTQNRLFNDLNQQGTLFWRSLEHLSKTVDISQKAQSLHFDSNSKERYFNVCLKNSARLSKLIQWLQADKNKQSQMKILVIDDEADQAGINTANVDTAERKRINKLICALVNGQTETAEEADTKYKAMNYIGYTATPYANILNEASLESLYPRNFITTLAVSKEYFGPQQIFGYSGDNASFEGLDIVRTIDDNQLQMIKQIHDGEQYIAPDCLLNSICWFLCGVSCMRIWGHKKPVSMLVHTSQITAHHKNIAMVIREWLEKTPKEDIVSRAKDVWKYETERFTFEKFRDQYPSYDRTDEEINRYPSFEDIKVQLETMLSAGTSYIELDSEGELNYHKGIHLCIDNCSNNGTNDGWHVRLAYPEASKMPSPAPAFIVVGGATLSRGLTLEGLMSTFFLRSVGQADTLMQMGRWFGYRKGYELLPRLWITEKTKEQFKFLAALDQELRDEIQYMDINGRSPDEYGPKVKNSPKVSFIKITSKNKMQSATESTFDYSGASNQTYLFDNDSEILDNNIHVTEEFLGSLGEEWKRPAKDTAFKNTPVWRNVPFSLVRNYIERFRFQKRLGVFNNITPLLDWVGKVTDEGKLDNWNIIVASKDKDTNGDWTLPNGRKVYKVNRSKKTSISEVDEKLIDIGALRDPRDLLADIDIESIKNLGVRTEVEKYISDGFSKGAAGIRDKSGLETTPQMLIYRIDMNSVPAGKTTTREALGAKRDIIGICLYIPGGKIGTTYASTVSIKMKNDIFDGDSDLEGANED